MTRNRYEELMLFLRSRDAVIYQSASRACYQTTKANLTCIQLAIDGKRVFLLSSHVKHSMMRLLDIVSGVEPNLNWSSLNSTITLPNGGSITIMQISEMAKERLQGVKRGCVVVDSDYWKR